MVGEGRGKLYVGRRQRPWWRVASWQLCQEKTDPSLLPPQTKGLLFWVALVRLLTANLLRAHSQTIIKASLNEHSTHKWECITKTCLYVCLFVCGHIT